MFGSGRSALDKGLDAFALRRWRAARRHLEDAAGDDNPRAIGDYHLGLLYWRGLGGPRNREAAAESFRRAAERGHAAAQTALGQALSAGVGAPRDIDEAEALFRSAASAGDVSAMTHLALISAPDDAHRLLERAAEQGHAPAMRQLSDMLLADRPVDALAWLYVCVAASDDPAATKRARRLAKEMTADEIALAQRQGRGFLRQMRQAQRR